MNELNNATANQTAQDFANLVAQASRFFNGLAKHKVFASGDLDLTEWVMLTQISSLDGITINGLAKTLGIAKAHANTIVGSLESRNYILVYEQNNDGTKRITMTEEGAMLCEKLSSEIEPLINGVIGDKRTLVKGVSNFFALLNKHLSE
jgi:DNA-binding MarR family transcriptional regulator